MRQKYGLTLEEFARIIRATRAYISKLERGVSSNPSPRIIQQICQAFSVDEDWLLKGEGEPFSLPSLNELANSDASIVRVNLKSLSDSGQGKKFIMAPALLHSMLQYRSKNDLLRDLLSFLKNPPYAPALSLETAQAIACVLEASTEKTVLTELNASVKSQIVRPLMPQLLKRLDEATKEQGSKSGLAKSLGVSLASVSQWLSGKREPGGETTLRLLQWVEAEERRSK